MDRPNILFILTDQFRHDCLGCLDHPVVRTPNLDRLAGDGVLFTSAYCATMACAPARASMMTGLHANGHHVRSNIRPLDPPDLPVLPQLLQGAGYDTALVGKLHLKPFHRDFGFRHAACGGPVGATSLSRFVGAGKLLSQRRIPAPLVIGTWSLGICPHRGCAPERSVGLLAT